MEDVHKDPTTAGDLFVSLGVRLLVLFIVTFPIVLALTPNNLVEYIAGFACGTPCAFVALAYILHGIGRSD